LAALALTIGPLAVWSAIRHLDRGYHRTMTQYATPASVRGDFADVTLSDGGDEIYLPAPRG